MAKSAQAFRTIREVADWLDVAAHVLRFWESKFNQIKPVKRAGGRRYYRPADMELVGGIKVLLHDRGLTIRGVQKMIADEGIDAVTSLSPPLDGLLGDDAAAIEGTARDVTPDADTLEPDGDAVDTTDPIAANAAPSADSTPEQTTTQSPEPEPEIASADTPAPAQASPPIALEPTPSTNEDTSASGEPNTGEPDEDPGEAAADALFVASTPPPSPEPAEADPTPTATTADEIASAGESLGKLNTLTARLPDLPDTARTTWPPQIAALRALSARMARPDRPNQRR